jgi:toxin secretion/phage lysis holin
VANIVDYITAILGAFSRGEKIDINKSIKGIVKKINLLILVCVSLMIDALINHYFGTENYTFITASVIIWLTMHEILSILENIGRNNDIKIPKILLDMVERLKNE